MSAVEIVYLLTVMGGAVFAVAELKLIWRFLRVRDTKARKQTNDKELVREDLPHVVIQIPLYNERVHAKRVIQAAADQDYPSDRLTIQVLDDSTDETSQIVADAVKHAQSRGVKIEHIRRQSRAGYKAGALAYGLTRTQSEFIAIFDADFCPSPQFLLQLLQPQGAFADPKIAFVQTRWAHENADDNMLTRTQALLIDRHFYLQKPTRQHFGNVTFFNGSGGIWRRSAIDAAGGWQADTVTEDLDLSFRCTFKGFRGHFAGDVSVPSELPTHMSAFKTQQRRWARGTLQCLRKLAWKVWRAKSVKEPLDELVNMSSYVIHVMMLANVLIWPWAVFYVQRELFWVLQGLMSFTLFVAPASLALTEIERRGTFDRQTLRDALVSTAIGLGLMVNNTVGILSGAAASGGVFERTPKTRNQQSRPRPYRASLHWTLIGEVALLAYLGWSAGILIQAGEWFWVPPTFIWAVCVAVVIAMQLYPQRDCVVGSTQLRAT